MALLDLSLISETLKRFIDFYFQASSEWTDTDRPGVSVKPPDILDSDTLGIYLYHITEDSYHKNLPSIGGDVPQIPHVPMGLNLYYQLTAKCVENPNDDTGTLKEQKIVGLAIKALHDFPVIDDSTICFDKNGIEQKAFPSGLQETDNRIRIVLQPIAHNEAMNYWSAANKSTRLAAYYQVSVVLLEPEEMQSRPGKVLTYGVHTFVEGPPRIDSCKNTLSFTIPGEAEPREVELSPAQVSPVITTPLPDPIPVDHIISFIGSGFNTGTTFQLLLKDSKSELVEVEQSFWKIALTNEGLNAVIRETVESGGLTAILPGIYSAIIKVIKQIDLPDGTIRDLEHLSNQCPFTITPRITKVDQGDPLTTTVTITGCGFSGDVSVYVSDRKFKLVTGVPTAGEFIVDSVTQVRVELQMVDPDGNPYTSGTLHSIRIFVNGAESAPRWIEYP